MGGGVFVRRNDAYIEMVEEPYPLEGHLQELIERHPNLLAGDQVNPEAPRRWLMLSREAGSRLRKAAPAAGASTTCCSTRMQSRRSWR